MPSYSRILIFISFLLFSGCTQTSYNNTKSNILKKEFKYKSFAHEDKYIMFALEFSKQGQLEEARELYKRLYNETSKEEYLFEYVKLSYTLKKYEDIIYFVQKNKKNIEKQKLNINKVYIISLVSIGNFEEAKKETIELLKEEKSNKNYELLGNIYIQKNEFKNAKELYKKIYEEKGSSEILLNLVNVMYLYLQEKEQAINLLESYTKLNGCNTRVCSKLLSFYQEQKNIDGIISVLERTYYKLKEQNNKTTLEKVYKLLMFYLEKKDINEAISFLEKSQANNERLLTLYRNSKKYDKALILANKLYEKSSNIDYLAQIAIIKFEMAKNKKDVIKDVIKKFENVLTVLDNHVYQNYLGYILIDFDIDIKRGLYFVNKALEKAPNNLAYIDSLAWGQYKLNDCKNAYKNMKKVVDSAGLEDEEIKSHWEKIKECNK